MKIPDSNPVLPPRPLVVPIFLPHAGCNHRCVFCNQNVVSGTEQALPSAERVRKKIRSFLARCKPRSEVLIAYYGGNFLGLSEDRIRRLLDLAARFVSEKRAAGIRFSTRPDTVDDRRLALLRPFPVHTVELGVQSMDDRVLSRCRRGHSADESAVAHRRLQEAGYRTGIQLMIGLPGQKQRSAMATADKVALLCPDFVRIYPTLVLAGSPLARWFRQKRYAPLPLKTAVSQAASLFRVFAAAGIEVVRMGLQTTPELEQGKGLIAGPHHPSFGELARSEAVLAEVSSVISDIGPPGRVRIDVHPCLESQLRGARNGNLRRLERRFGRFAVTIRKNAGLDRRTLRIEAGKKVHELALFSRPVG